MLIRVKAISRFRTPRCGLRWRTCGSAAGSFSGSSSPPWSASGETLRKSSFARLLYFVTLNELHIPFYAPRFIAIDLTICSCAMRARRTIARRPHYARILSLTPASSHRPPSAAVRFVRAARRTVASPRASPTPYAPRRCTSAGGPSRARTLRRRRTRRRRR